MAWQQTRAFNSATAGTKLGWCLQNVRLGYGIAAKYPNAIGAWNNTEQHKDRSIPLGVAVPLYYSWKTDGHINVRLPDGRVWSDGRIYSSLSNFESIATPVFLGWGESVNNVRVIQFNQPPISGGGVTMNNESGTELYRTGLFREPENATVAGQWNGQPPEQALRAVRGAEWQSIKARLEAYPKLEKAVSDLQTALINEKNKPPEKVIETTEKIVEKPVEVIKEVPVYIHDTETKENVGTILKIVKTIKGMVANLFKKKV